MYLVYRMDIQVIGAMPSQKAVFCILGGQMMVGSILTQLPPAPQVAAQFMHVQNQRLRKIPIVFLSAFPVGRVNMLALDSHPVPTAQRERNIHCEDKYHLRRAQIACLQQSSVFQICMYVLLMYWHTIQ